MFILPFWESLTFKTTLAVMMSQELVTKTGRILLWFGIGQLWPYPSVPSDCPSAIEVTWRIWANQSPESTKNCYFPRNNRVHSLWDIDGSAQDCSNSSALVLELPHSCTTLQETAPSHVNGPLLTPLNSLWSFVPNAVSNPPEFGEPAT